MAENIKISLLDELTVAQNSTIVPVVDGGTTQKMSLSTLQTHLTASFVTPSQLSTQISNVTSTISGLDTDDINEGSTNLYYTNARVDERILDIVEITSSAGVDALEIQNLSPAVIAIMDVEGVLSGSINVSSITDFDTEVSRSAAEAGFGAGGGGVASGSVPIGTVSSSAQITELGFINQTVTSSMTVLSASYALTASYAENAGGGGGTDYISNVEIDGTILTFTGVGNAFNSTVNLTDGDILTLDDGDSIYVDYNSYIIESESFASRITNSNGGSVPLGTVSSSIQTIEHLGGTDIVSSSTQALEVLGGTGIISASAQVQLAQVNTAGFTTDAVPTGSQNFYYTNALVKSYLNQISVVSGSIEASTNLGGTGVISASEQIELLGFPTNTTFGTATQSLQNQIDAIDTGVSLNDVNVFLAEQFFTQGVRITGSLLLTDGSYSGSGANLYGIPADAIVGSVGVAATSLSDGDNSITANSLTGITINSPTGSVRITAGNLVISSGSIISGSGAGLFDIPGSAIVGGVGGGTSIATGSVTASVHPTLGLIVNSDISASGDITARSINVGTSGTPTIFSNTNLNLSASNAVVITDSPLRLTPFTNAQTASFSLSNGDLVYNSTTHDFYGYKSGSWISLTAGSGGSVNWAQIIGIPSGLISSSAGFVSSSVQIAPAGGAGDVLFKNSLGIVTSSALFRFTEGTDTLTSPTMSVGVLSYNSLSGPALETGSFNLVDTDRIIINNDYELPTSDGAVDQFIKTNGAGITSFGNVSYSQLEGVPSGIITSSNQLVELDVALEAQANTFTFSQIISGSLYVTESVIADVLVLTPKHPKPTLPETGSIIVSASSAGPMRPFFFDGSTWTQMFT